MQKSGRNVVRNRSRYGADARSTATVVKFDRFPASTCSRVSSGMAWEYVKHMKSLK